MIDLAILLGIVSVQLIVAMTTMKVTYIILDKLAVAFS